MILFCKDLRDTTLPVHKLVSLHPESLQANRSGNLTSQQQKDFGALSGLPTPQRVKEFGHAYRGGGPDVDLKSRRIMVVDDNRDSADSLALLLKSLGHEVQTAYDGFEAIDQMDRFNADVIVLDIGMPRLD